MKQVSFSLVRGASRVGAGIFRGNVTAIPAEPRRRVAAAALRAIRRNPLGSCLFFQGFQGRVAASWAIEFPCAALEGFELFFYQRKQREASCDRGERSSFIQLMKIESSSEACLQEPRLTTRATRP